MKSTLVSNSEISYKTPGEFEENRFEKFTMIFQKKREASAIVSMRNCSID
jgi:hypothetical protein